MAKFLALKEILISRNVSNFWNNSRMDRTKVQPKNLFDASIVFQQR